MVPGLACVKKSQKEKGKQGNGDCDTNENRTVEAGRGRLQFKRTRTTAKTSLTPFSPPAPKVKQALHGRRLMLSYLRIALP